MQEETAKRRSRALRRWCGRAGRRTGSGCRQPVLLGRAKKDQLCDGTKKGHQRRGLWPKTSLLMTLMRHFVCLGVEQSGCQTRQTDSKWLSRLSEKNTCK